MKTKLKKVLNGVNGTIRSGRVTAIMGPSGAGKTTFLTTLAGKSYYGVTGGKILLNGKKSSISNIRKVMGFVPQEDTMLRMLTVKEILNFNAEFRLPQSTPIKEKRELVNSVIEMLDLYEVQHSPIGDESKRGVSGGQRKRVNIGMELVADPTILFLDEPTSGLDSSGSLKVCQILRDVADLGFTVATVIHQPRYDIFTMFHDVLLLGKGGRTVYLGPTEEALPYFTNLGFSIPEHTNPADFFMDVISGSVDREGHPNFRPEDLFELWSQHKGEFELKDDEAIEARKGHILGSDPMLTEGLLENENNKQVGIVLEEKMERIHVEKSSWFMQLFLFLTRSVRQQGRDLFALITDVVLCVVASGFFGLVFINSVYIGPPPKIACDPLNGALRYRCLLPIDDPVFGISSLVTLIIAMTAVTSALRVFGPERVVFWRESSAGANTFAYFIGKDLAHFPNLFILPLIFLGVFYTILAPRASFLLLYIILVSVWFCATALAYIVSVLVKPSMSQVIAVISIFAFMMFSGARPTIPEMQNMFFPMTILYHISFLRYSNEAFYIAEIREWTNIYNVSSGLELYGYHLDTLPLNIGVVFGIGVGFRIIAAIILHFYERDKRR